MNRRKTVLFYCQHSMGMGHLFRSLTLANAISGHFRVVLLNGGEFPAGMTIPRGIEIIQLPPLGQDSSQTLDSLDRRYSLAKARRIRKEMILAAFTEIIPEVLFIELFPFGRKKFSGELLPLLESSNRLGDQRPLVVCSLRDILIGQRNDQIAHENRASLLANRYFDAVLAHADPVLATLDETFNPAIPLDIPVYYTGYAVAKEPAHQVDFSLSATVLVSAGGGRYGYQIFKAAAAISPQLWYSFGLRTRIVTGPFFPDAEFRSLTRLTEQQDYLSVVRFVPKLFEEMLQARISVSQAGYNTSMDLLQCKIPALVIPFSQGGEDEQLMRARRLAAENQLHLLPSELLSATTLYAAIDNLLRFTPAPTPYNLDGASRTAEILSTMLSHRITNRRQGGNSKPVYDQWLEPVFSALNEREKTIRIFFRDDDAGWRTDRLLKLTDLFDKYAAPVDIAVIPAAVDTTLAKTLLRLKQRAPARIGLHQHGYTHTNHEQEGRKCEFGVSRSFAEQLADIQDGKMLLEKNLGSEALDPIFTPPWNRCAGDITAECLVAAGFDLLSRDVSAAACAHPDLMNLDIHIDWSRKHKGVSITSAQRGELIADQIRSRGTVGMMLHHAVMETTDFEELDQLLALLCGHGLVKFFQMYTLASLARLGSSNARSVLAGARP